MIKAKITSFPSCDRLARYYYDNDQCKMNMEATIQTKAKEGDRVSLPELNAERSVFRSQFDHSVMVVHITAEEWLYLRGLERAQPHVFYASQQITE